MKRIVHLMLLNGFILLIAACVSTPEREGSTVVHQTGAAGASTAVRPAEGPRSDADAEVAARMQEYLQNGKNKVQQGAISEGVTQLVSVLAEADRLPAPAARVRDLVFAAETELSKIGAALEVEGGTEWMDANKNQISASSIDVGTNKGMNPSVTLTLNLGGGKALVSGAPIFFEFVKGSGLLTSYVNTTDYGQANCVITRLENPNEENIVRASLIYRVNGFAYRFAGLEKDFVYIPPARKATILVLEKAGDQTNADPVILDAVFNRLKGVAFDFSHYNGVLLGDRFVQVFGGEMRQIQNLGLEKGVSYLVMVLNDGYYVNQLEMGGKKYNIYKSQTTATTRIIRVVDGKILYSGTVQGVSGQGGTEQKAVLDGFRAAAEAMSGKLGEDFNQIMEALSGTRG